MTYKAQMIPDDGNRYTPRKMEKLKKIQLAMIAWLEGKGIDKSKEHNDTWQERFSYVLSCEKKDLDKDDIVMLNNIWKEYGR